MSPKSLFNIDRLIDHLVGFIETRLEILKLDFKEESVRVVAIILTIAVKVLFGTLFFIFISVALGLYLNQILESAYLGFVILAGFFFLLWMSVLIIRRTSWYNDLIASITDRIVEDSNNQKNERRSEIKGSSQ
jgi:uncharacterized membrane protein YqjE